MAPGYDPDLFPQGVNIELVTALDVTGAVDMRVYERGVGETRSCGTGTVAAAAAALAAGGFRIAEDTGEVTVRVPGGEVSVALERGRARLRGPSVLVATGRIMRRVVAGPVTGPRPRISTCAVLGFRGSMDGV